MFTHDNSKKNSVEPGPMANGFSFLVNGNPMEWKGEEERSGISGCVCVFYKLIKVNPPN